MNAPRIKVRVLKNWLALVPWSTTRYWTCTGCKPFLFGGPGDMTDTIAAAVDAGRKHLEDVHGIITRRLIMCDHDDSVYCRTHGVGRAECGCSQPPKPAESGSDFVSTIPEGTSAAHATHNLSREDC